MKLGVSLMVLGGIFAGARVKTRWIRFFQLAGVWPHIE
jgi:hypothetical protein